MSQKQLAGLRKFNRWITNPVIRLVAGNFGFALVTHKGRRSGNEYSTPVLAAMKDQLIYAGLPYGTDTDWLLNVQAAGTCQVKINGTTYQASKPELVLPEEALPAFSAGYREKFAKASIKPETFLRLEIEA